VYISKSEFQMNDRREHRGGGGQESDVGTAQETERGARLREHAQMKRRAERKREPQVVEPNADEISEVAIEERDIQKVRNRLAERVGLARDMGWLALERFQSLLRSREAAPAIEKGFAQTAKKSAVDWYSGKLKEGVRAVFAAIEVPLAPVEKVLGFARESLDGTTQADQAAAKVQAVDQIVDETRHAILRTTAAFQAAIAGADPMDLFKADAAIDDQIPIISSGDVDEMIAKMTALLNETLYKSGSLTTNEYLDRFQHDRRHLSKEIDATKEQEHE
jgi:hypothetical protein